jgi:hypothetical protein
VSGEPPVAWEIDLRLHDLRRELARMEDTGEEFDLAWVAAMMRAAYAKGYVDALVEPEPGKWITEYGYKVPAKAKRG